MRACIAGKPLDHWQRGGWRTDQDGQQFPGQSGFYDRVLSVQEIKTGSKQEWREELRKFQQANNSQHCCCLPVSLGDLQAEELLLMAALCRHSGQQAEWGSWHFPRLMHI